MKENMEFYARCSYFWPKFHDEGAIVYSTVVECGYKEPLTCRTREEADEIIKKMNEDRPCPKCQKIHKWKAMTEFEIGQQENMIANIMNKDISKQR